MKTSIFLLTCFSFACSTVIFSHQNVESDSSRWFPFETTIEMSRIFYRLPPDGIVFVDPRQAKKGIVENDGYKIFAAIGYDYGSKSNPGLSKFTIRLSVSNLKKSIDEKFVFGEFAKQVLEQEGNPTLAAAEIKQIGQHTWFIETYPDNASVTYSTPLNSGAFLSVEAYFDKGLRKNVHWLEERKKLVNEIVRNVRW